MAQHGDESREDPALRRYRLFLTVFILAAALIVITVGGVLVTKGKLFEGFLALLVLGYLVLLLRGYRQDAQDRS